MLTVQFADHSERIQELIARKAEAACVAAANVLAEKYVEILMTTEAPEHSDPGEIPHHYLGFIQGGYGPVNKLPEVRNNTPKQGFASRQTANLATFISSGTNSRNIGAVVGFRPGHVTSRSKNYLIQHDQGDVPQFPGVERPWIIPGYRRCQDTMQTAASAAFKEAK